MIIIDLKFKPKSVKEAEEYYKTLHVASDQKYIVIAISKLIDKYIPIPERAIRGFIWKTIREWQLQYKTDLSELSTMNSAERVNAVKQIIEIFETMMKRILIDTDQEPALKEAMQQALNIYNEKFANR